MAQPNTPDPQNLVENGGEDALSEGVPDQFELQEALSALAPAKSLLTRRVNGLNALLCGQKQYTRQELVTAMSDVDVSCAAMMAQLEQCVQRGLRTDHPSYVDCQTRKAQCDGHYREIFEARLADFNAHDSLTIPQELPCTTGALRTSQRSVRTEISPSSVVHSQLSSKSAVVLRKALDLKIKNDERRLRREQRERMRQLQAQEKAHRLRQEAERREREAQRQAEREEREAQLEQELIQQNMELQRQAAEDELEEQQDALAEDRLRWQSEIAAAVKTPGPVASVLGQKSVHAPAHSIVSHRSSRASQIINNMFRGSQRNQNTPSEVASNSSQGTINNLLQELSTQNNSPTGDALGAKDPVVHVSTSSTSLANNPHLATDAPRAPQVDLPRNQIPLCNTPLAPQPRMKNNLNSAFIENSGVAPLLSRAPNCSLNPPLSTVPRL